MGYYDTVNDCRAPNSRWERPFSRPLTDSDIDIHPYKTTPVQPKFHGPLWDFTPWSANQNRASFRIGSLSEGTTFAWLAGGQKITEPSRAQLLNCVRGGRRSPRTEADCLVTGPAELLFASLYRTYTFNELRWLAPFDTICVFPYLMCINLKDLGMFDLWNRLMKLNDYFYRIFILLFDKDLF